MGFGSFKGFLDGIAAGQKLVGSADDREYKRLKNKLAQAQLAAATDPETLKLKKDGLRADIQRKLRGPVMHPAQQRALESRTNYYNTMQENLKNAPKAPSAVDDATPSYGPRPGAPAQVGAVEDGGDVRLSSLEDEEEDETEPAMYAARGGYVKHFADGGAVDDDMPDEESAPDEVEPDNDEDDLPEAVPTTTAPTAAPTGSLGYSPQAAHDATLAGMKYALKATGAEQERAGVDEFSSQNRQRGQRAYLSGQGAASQAEMTAIYKAIDPKGEMSESERTMAGLAHVYEWNLKRNDPAGAQKAAASMIQYGRIVSSRYQAIAAAAAEKGDVDGSLRAILKAHSAVPDGKDMKLIKRPDGTVAYSFTDLQSGKTVEQGVATPEQILSFATKGGATSFDQIISSAAGQRAGTKAPKEAAPRSVEDRDEVAGKIDTAATKVLGAKASELSDTTRFLAGQILSNNDVSPEASLGIVGELIKPGAPSFKWNKDKDGVVLADGRQVKLSREAISNIAIAKGKADKDFAAKQEADSAKAQAVADEKAAQDKLTASRMENSKRMNRNFQQRGGAIKPDPAYGAVPE